MLTSVFNDFAKALGSSQRVFDLIDRSAHPTFLTPFPDPASHATTGFYTDQKLLKANSHKKLSTLFGFQTKYF